MAEIVNLRMARKRRDRAERERLAAENRARHGQGKTQRVIARKRAEHASSMLDGHLRDRPRDGD